MPPEFAGRVAKHIAHRPAVVQGIRVGPADLDQPVDSGPQVAPTAVGTLLSIAASAAPMSLRSSKLSPDTFT